MLHNTCHSAVGLILYKYISTNEEIPVYTGKFLVVKNLLAKLPYQHTGTACTRRLFLQYVQRD
jgi:hypothetical protein